MVTVPGAVAALVAAHAATVAADQVVRICQLTDLGRRW
jgi:hypothetical protein